MRISLSVTWLAAAVIALAAAQSPSYLVFVSNERSGDVTVIDGATDEVVGTLPVGKRPRGIHATPDGRRENRRIEIILLPDLSELPMLPEDMAQAAEAKLGK